MNKRVKEIMNKVIGFNHGKKNKNLKFKIGACLL